MTDGCERRLNCRVCSTDLRPPPDSVRTGTFCICWHCGEVSVYTVGASCGAVAIRPPTDEETERFGAEPFTHFSLMAAQRRREWSRKMTEAMPEDLIIDNLNFMLSSSRPGDALHHLHVITAEPGALGPLGLADEAKIAVTVYAIDADSRSGQSAEDFIRDTIVMAAGLTQRDKRIPVFAALAEEVWIAPADELASKLRREGSIRDHPDMSEVTVVYGAARDGRRWRGRRFLTGPMAGTTQAVDLIVGPPQQGESHGVTGAPLLRRFVGMSS